jgi:hypothetical protein
MPRRRCRNPQTLPSVGIFDFGDPNPANRIDELMEGFGEDSLPDDMRDRLRTLRDQGA